MAIHKLQMNTFPGEECWFNYLCFNTKCLWTSDYAPKGGVCPKCGSDVHRIETVEDGE